MNNKLIVMAIAAGLAFPLTAIAGAKVGGHMQIELNSPDVKDSQSTAADELKLTDNARGRLRISGDEDLGGGLKSIYLAEWRINTDLGGLGTNQREAYVGLKGGFGTFYAGNSASPYKGNAGTDFDPYTATVLEARRNGGALSDEGTMTRNYGVNGFLANSLNYKKKMGAVKFHIQYHLSEAQTSTRDSTVAFAVRGKVGAGIEVVGAYIQESAVKTALLEEGGTRTKLGLTWKGGPHKVNARFETQSDDRADNDATAIFAGYHLTMGKNVLTLQYGTIDGKAVADDKTYTMIAIKHKLSKKTNAWLGYRATDFNTDAALTAHNGQYTNDNTVISAGLRIKF